MGSDDNWGGSGNPATPFPAMPPARGALGPSVPSTVHVDVGEGVLVPVGVVSSSSPTSIIMIKVSPPPSDSESWSPPLNSGGSPPGSSSCLTSCTPPSALSLSPSQEGAGTPAPGLEEEEEGW